MYLIAGLGNPGAQYAKNRHNIGFMLIDELARGTAFGPERKRFQALSHDGLIDTPKGQEKLLVLKPQTYMNNSGQSVREACDFYKIKPEHVIVFHDELDLAPGRLRMKLGGGHAGHNGLRSIMAHIGPNFVRGRMGIGHPGDKALVLNWVLADFARGGPAVARCAQRCLRQSPANAVLGRTRCRRSLPGRSHASRARPQVRCTPAQQRPVRNLTFTRNVFWAKV